MVGQELSVRPEPPESKPARAILRAYLDEVVSRFHGRRLTADELDGAVEEFPGGELLLPRGMLLVAWLGDHPVGCVGLRFVEAGTGEVIRVFVDSQHRRRGIARALMSEVERQAREHCVRRLRLDTRHDLVEARALYTSIGFCEVDPFNDGPYADHWFERTLL